MGAKLMKNKRNHFIENNQEIGVSAILFEPDIDLGTLVAIILS